MAAQSALIACSSTPQVVAGSIGTDGAAIHGYIRVRLKMIAGTAYLGSSSVTTGGYPLTTADASIDVSLITGETLYVASRFRRPALLSCGSMRRPNGQG